MNKEDAYSMILKALEGVEKGASEKVTVESDLAKDEILDSLDLMNFLFELEELNGSKLVEITDEFDDFRIGRLIEVVCEQ